MRFKFSPVIFCIILFFAITISYAQSPEHYPSSKILQEIKKLNVLGNVLYLAAHPDDENTRLIAYLKNEKLLNTSYLSLTRGDGGQNLIGAEQGNLLGIIRTQELLQARKAELEILDFLKLQMKHLIFGIKSKFYQMLYGPLEI